MQQEQAERGEQQGEEAELGGESQEEAVGGALAWAVLDEAQAGTPKSRDGDLRRHKEPSMASSVNHSCRARWPNEWAAQFRGAIGLTSQTTPSLCPSHHPPQESGH